MAEVLKIEGGHPLSGTVSISGAKNATVALIPAAILASEGMIDMFNVPEIDDVDSLVALLNHLHVKTEFPDKEHIRIDVSEMEYEDLDHPAATKLRASYYFMGALLGKYKKVKMKMPGGCYLGPRPIDLHLKGFEALGATVEYDASGYSIVAKELVGAKIYLDIASVGATINIILAAVYAKGRTTIENAAKEPEIVDVANFLNKMGAKIRGTGTNVITIDGVDKLVGSVHDIIPDRIEAGTYIIIAAAAAKKMTITNIIPQHLEALLSKLQEIGVKMDVDVDQVTIYGEQAYHGVDVQTAAYPGFATDLQQPLSALLTQASGGSLVKETIYQERFKHCQELIRMGANIQVSYAQATITGQTKLFGCDVVATDLRCGASLVVAGLMATGVTTIHDVYHIDRGYDSLDEKLTRLGAVVFREEETSDK